MDGTDMATLPPSPTQVAKKKKLAAEERKKAASTIGMLDHNNMSKSTSPNRKLAPNRLLKTTKPPPLRKYPGQMRKILKGTVTGAVYAEDLEKEEAERQAMYEAMYGVQTEMTAEDLMRDPQ